MVNLYSEGLFFGLMVICCFFFGICAKRCRFEGYSFCELVILLIYMWLTGILKNCFFV